MAAKYIQRQLSGGTCTDTKAFFDEIAEDCSILTVSMENNVLTLTIDTDLIVRIGWTNATSANVSVRTVTFNGNTLANNTSSYGIGSSPTMVVIYDTDFFFTHIFSNTGYSVMALYTKVNSDKYGYGGLNQTSLSNTFNLTSMDNVAYPRLTILNYYTNSSGYIDYVPQSVFTKNSVKRIVVDRLYSCSLMTTPNILINFGNQNYYVIAASSIIPVDLPEEE